MTVKDLRYVDINFINLLYLIINKINGYIDENKNWAHEKINENKYLTLVPTDERKDTLLV